MTTMNKLTPLQAAFVAEYLKDFNATRAYQRAAVASGKPEPSIKCAGTSGPRELERVGIQQALAREIQKRNERVQIDQDYVLRHLIMNLQRALQAVPVLDKEGNETGMWQYNGSVANGALALLAKHTGGFADRMEHSGPGGGPIQIETLNVYHREIVQAVLVAYQGLPGVEAANERFIQLAQGIAEKHLPKLKEGEK